ncbi:MAG: polysaccharide deacetylase family protein [Sulfurovaceae bacterium]|nr:polysaccharide deacetylase family protein [Sulfurovaceae bacterium]
MLHRVLEKIEPDNYYFQRKTAISWQCFIKLLDKIEEDNQQTAVISQLEKHSKDNVYITFDDGYLDNAPALDEILRRGMVATLYPVKNFIETNFSIIDDMAHHLMQYPSTNSKLKKSLISGRFKNILKKISVHRYRYLRQHIFNISSDYPYKRLFLHTLQLKYYLKAGIELGIHGCSHQIFTTLSTQQLAQELKQASDWLYYLGAKKKLSICFPHGKFNSQVIAQCYDYSHLLLGVDTKITDQAVFKRLHVQEK